MSESAGSLLKYNIRPGLPAKVSVALYKEIRGMLEDGIPPEPIAEALREWDNSPGLNPASLQYLVGNAVRRLHLRGKDEERVAKMLDWESQLREEMGD